MKILMYDLAREQSWVSEYWRRILPDIRELGCPSICNSTWELTKGALFENQWERAAAATAVYEGKSRADFNKRFFGSARADQYRLQHLLGDEELAKIHPVFGGSFVRHAFMGTESAWLFYHMNAQPDTHAQWDRAMLRVRRARKIVRQIQRAATRRKEYLRHLDLPLDLFEVMHERVRTLGTIRAAVDRIYPHRLGASPGTRLLRQVIRTLARHIARCEKLAERFELLQRTRGCTHLDAFRLRRQIRDLQILKG